MVARFLAFARQQVFGLIALFVALGGTSYAVATGSIDSREIKNNSIRSKDVRNGSLLKKDFKSGQLPAGPAGARGATGTPGAPGAARGYAHVREDGTLDAARSKGVVDVRPGCSAPCEPLLPHTQSLWQCFDLTFTPVNAVATHENPSILVPQSQSISVNVPGPAPVSGQPYVGCPAGYRDAMTYMATNGGFFILFN